MPTKNTYFGKVEAVNLKDKKISLKYLIGKTLEQTIEIDLGLYKPQIGQEVTIKRRRVPTTHTPTFEYNFYVLAKNGYEQNYLGSVKDLPGAN